MSPSIEKKPSKTKVLIVGAGPVGLTLGVLLARNNVDFKLIDQLQERGKYSRAFIIHSRTLEIFEQLGIMEQVKKEGKSSVIGLEYFRDDQLGLKVDLPGAISSQPETVGLLQSQTEIILENKLNELGHKVEYNKQLTQLIEDGKSNYNKAIINDKETIEFDFIIGCDGGRSKVRKLSNIEFQGQSLDIQVTCLDAEVETTELNQTQFATILTTKKDMAFIFWLGENKARFILSKPKEEEEISDEGFIHLIKKLTSKIKINNITWKSTFGINECHAKEFNKNNLYLCGDAAHTHSPAGGFGMNTGIQDAYNLSWKLSWIIKGIANPKILSDNFNEERKMTAQIAIKESGSRIRTSFGESSWLWDILKRWLLSYIVSINFIKVNMVDTLSGVGIDYPNNILIKKINQGIIYNSFYKGVGKRINDYKLLLLKEQQPTTMHKLLNGKDKFELFVYLPKQLLEVNGFNKLFKWIDNLNQSKFQQIQQRGEDKLININLLLNEPLNIDEYINSLSNHFDNNQISQVKSNLLEYSLIIDDNNMFYDLNISIDYPSVMVVRPDAYIGLLKSAEDLGPVVDYFNGFMC